MEGVSEIVEDWADLVWQVNEKSAGQYLNLAPIIAAILLMAREIKYNRTDT